MDRVLIIGWHEYKVNVRRLDFIIFTSLVPVLGLVGLLVTLFFGRQAGGALVRMFDSGSKVTAVVDQSGRLTPLMPQFAEAFAAYDDEAAARAALETEAVQRVVVVPAGYPQAGDVKVITAESRFSGAGTTGLRTFFVTHLARDIEDGALRARLIDPFDAQIEYTGERGQATGGVAGEVLSFLVPFLFSILLAVTVFVSSGYLVRSVAEEKSSRVIEIVLSSVTPQQLLAGKVLGLGALGLTQIAVWIASATGLGGGLAVLAGVILPFFTRMEVFGLALVYYILGFGVYSSVDRRDWGDGVQPPGEPADYRHCDLYRRGSDDADGGHHDESRCDGGAGDVVVSLDRADDDDVASATGGAAAARCCRQHCESTGSDTVCRVVWGEDVSAGDVDVWQAPWRAGDCALVATHVGRIRRWRPPSGARG